MWPYELIIEYFSYLKQISQDYPGGPVVKTSPSKAGGSGLIPSQGNASWPKNQNIKQKQYCKKFNKDFKNGPYPENSFKKKKNVWRKRKIHEVLWSKTWAQNHVKSKLNEKLWEQKINAQKW